MTLPNSGCRCAGTADARGSRRRTGPAHRGSPGVRAWATLAAIRLAFTGRTVHHKAALLLPGETCP